MTKASSRSDAATPSRSEAQAEDAALKQLFADRDAVYARNAAELDEHMDREKRARATQREMMANADRARSGGDTEKGG